MLPPPFQAIFAISCQSWPIFSRHTPRHYFIADIFRHTAFSFHLADIFSECCRRILFQIFGH